ncbi:MAG: alpha/beta fold hydrolase [Chloroflexi bacterium]|nr:alpha/beta fold hydrolase [Chloroflexota bacterium]
MMRHSAVILCADEMMLSGEVFLPEECNRIYPAVCICHGIPAVPYNPGEQGGYPELAARFCRAGFVSLVFNFRGCGPSQGNIDMLGWTHDLAAAIDFLAMLPEVDKNRICLIGSSGGAATCVYAAAKDKRVHAVATFACPAEFDFMAGGQTADTLIQRFREIGIIRDADFPASVEKWLEGFRTVAPIEYIDKIAPKPLLLVHGDRDEVVPLAHAEKLFAKAGQPKELVILRGAGHRLRQDERAINTAMKWLINAAG